MPSAKQIKARKLFAKRVKRGDFRKAISKTKKAKSNPHPKKYPKGAINKLFDKWLKKQYDYKSKGEKDDAIVEVAIELGVETPLSRAEKVKVLRKYRVI
jgi:hypothetical protein